jgi:hypothetical protein
MLIVPLTVNYDVEGLRLISHQQTALQAEENVCRAAAVSYVGAKYNSLAAADFGVLGVSAAVDVPVCSFDASLLGDHHYCDNVTDRRFRCEHQVSTVGASGRDPLAYAAGLCSVDVRSHYEKSRSSGYFQHLYRT